MRLYRINASSQVRIEYGVSLGRGLSRYDETRPYAGPFMAINSELKTKYEARLSLRYPLLEARQDLRFGDYDVDQGIRMFEKATEIADGHAKGPLSKALFANGVSPLVAPFGTKQLEPMREFVRLVQRSRVPGVDALRDAELPKLQAALTRFEAAVQAYTDARKDYFEAFAEELAVRDEHRLAVQRLMGQVQAAFPNDRAKQDLIFPDVQVSSGRAEDAGSDDEADPTDGAGSTT